MFEFLNRPKIDTADAAPAEGKASATGHAIAWPGAGRVAWSPRDDVSLTRTGFIGNPVGFRAVKITAEAAAALPVVLQDQERRYETHPIQALLARPNAAQGRAEIIEALYGQLLVTGNGYLEGVGDEGLPVELHVLWSDRMNIVSGADGWLVACGCGVNGHKHRFAVAPNETIVCHVKSSHPQDDHYGFSPMQASGSSIDVSCRLLAAVGGLDHSHFSMGACYAY